MPNYFRRTLRVVAFVGTIVVGIIALALIASQTPWFRGWLRGYVERQAKQYVNGTVSIGSLGGNLFYGIELGDIHVDVNGERVLTLKNVEVKYSIAELVSKGVTIQQIRLDEPDVLARRDAGGWNLAKMMKKQEREADRRGPAKPISLPDIEIVNGRATIDDRAPSSAYRYPSRIEGLHVKAGFEYAPVHYSLTLRQFAFVGKAPDLTIQNLAGRIGTRDDDLNVEKLFLQTPGSSVTFDGVIRNYLSSRSLQLTVSAPKLSLPEFGGVLPVVQGYNLHPTFDVKADGLLESLRLAFNVTSEAGDASGNVTADFRAPDLGVRGDVNLTHLDLAPILKNPAQKSDITGLARVDLKVASHPASATAMDRLRAHVVFSGPTVVALGYRASDVRATADITGHRIALDARVNGYGGSATARGFIVTAKAPGEPTVFDLAGSAAHINMATLPANLNAPRVTTSLNPTAYHVKGSVGRTTAVDGTATLAESTIAGGTILGGTTGEFALRGEGGGLQSLTYGGRGAVRDMNLQKVGEAFQIVALNKPEYDSRINTQFDVKGSGTTAATTRIDASGTATDSELFGATIPQVTYDVHLVNGSASARAEPRAGSGETSPKPLRGDGGPTEIQSLTYTARGEVRDLNLRRVGETFQIAALMKPEYDSRISTQFDVKGNGTTLDQIGLDTKGTLDGAKMYGGTLTRMAYEAHLAKGALSGRATGEFRDLDPALIFGNPRLKGKASGTVDATYSMKDTAAPVTPDAIAADGRLTLTPSEIGGLKIDAADIQGQYADRLGTLRQMTLKGPDLDLIASGPIALDQTGQTNVKYHVAATNLESLGKLADQPGLSGSAILDGTVTGNAIALKTDGTLDGSNIGYRDDNALDLNSKYAVTLPDLDLARVQVQAQSTGTFVQVRGIQINSLTATTTYADRKLDFQTHLVQSPSGGSRELDASGTVIFHPDHQELHLPTLALRTLGVEWTTAPGSSPTVKYGNDKIQVEGLKLVSADQELDVDGTFSTGDNPAIDGIQVRATNVDVAQLEKLALMNRGLTGRLNADAKIAGSTSAPAVTGHVAVANGGFQQFKYESLTADASYTNGRVGLDARLVQTPGVELTATGSFPLSALRAAPREGTAHTAVAPADAIDVRVQSTRMNLAIVQAFTKELADVTGTIQADVTITGSGLDPHLNGYVALQDGAFGVPQANVRFSGMTTRIELGEDRIRVPKFQILDEHGNPLTIQGELATHERGFGSVNVAIDSDDFKIVDNELGNVHLESHLKLTGEVRHPKLVGELRTDAGRLEIDRILLLFANPYAEEALPEVISAQETTTSAKGASEATRDALEKGRQVSAEKASEQKATAPQGPAPQTGLFSALALDVHLAAPDNLIVRGTDLRPGGATAAQVGSVNATLGLDLQVGKRENGPVTLSGTAKTVRGFYEFQGRRFTIQRDGNLKFNGLPQVNPDVDVVAERLIPNSGVTARIHITGTARAPQIALSSDPPLEEADILSLIVFNRSVNELGTGERASLAETAGGIASGFVASSLGRSIGKALDIDLFEITTSDDVTGDAAGGVTLGKQISDKAFVRFRQQFGQRSFTEFMLEYQLAKFLRAETRLSPETSGVANRLTQRRVERAGIDLIFFFSY